jgi:hypothetical protein
MRPLTFALGLILAASLWPTWQALQPLLQSAPPLDPHRIVIESGPSFTLHPKPLRPVDAEPDDFYDTIQEDLDAGSYDELDRMAESYRHPDALFRGAIPKLSVFYKALIEPRSGGPTPGPEQCDCLYTDADFNTVRAQLEDWIKTRPSTLTARIALAKLWLAYSWSERGGGPNRQINEDLWRATTERLSHAEYYLIDADPSQDPEALYTATEIAALRKDGHDRIQAIYQDAIRYFPWYYPYYSQHAQYIEKKWYGQPGEVAQYLKHLSAPENGIDGMLEYAYATNQLRQDTPRNLLFKDDIGLDFGTVIAAYQVREEQYGLRDRDWNTILYLAIGAERGRDVVDLALKETNGRWSPEVWHDQHASYESDIAWYRRHRQ